MSGVFSRRGSPPPPAPPAPPAPAAPEADPSMEDILASIRRILNEGEGGEAGAATVEASVAEAAPVQAPVAANVAATPEAGVVPEPVSVAGSEPVQGEEVF